MARKSVLPPTLPSQPAYVSLSEAYQDVIYLKSVGWPKAPAYQPARFTLRCDPAGRSRWELVELLGEPDASYEQARRQSKQLAKELGFLYGMVDPSLSCFPLGDLSSLS